MASTAADTLAGEFEAEGGRLRAGAVGGWGVWIARRLLLGVLILFLASILVFFATHALPSEPARAILGKDATPARVAALRHKLGLDQSLVGQYTSWLSGLAHGDLGTSLAAREPVTDLLGSRFVNSITLLVLVAVIGLPLAVGLGVGTAIRRDGVIDKATLTSSLVITALPEFVIGLALILIFATAVFTVLPAVAPIGQGETPFTHPDQLILPVATLVLVVVPYLYRLMRASMIDVLESEYVAMARLKGMPEHIVILRHALPNALVATIQGTAIVLTYLLGGVVVIEYVFHYPGLGGALTEAIANRDLPMIEALVMIFAAGVVLFNLVADMLTVLVTPRLRTGGRR